MRVVGVWLTNRVPNTINSAAAAVMCRQQQLPIQVKCLKTLWRSVSG
jgi:hypothetical protein